MKNQSDYMKKSLDIMSREQGIGVAFALQLALSIFLYFLTSYALYPDRIPDYLSPLMNGDFYPLFSFSILVVAGTVSVFIMTLVGSIVDTHSRKKRRKIRGHLMRAMHHTPYAVVAFLFPWIFTFGLPFLFFFLTREVFDDMCIITIFYYFVIWILLAKTFYTPYFIVRGKGIGDALEYSWKATTNKTIELSAITAFLYVFAYLAFLFTFSPYVEFYTETILLVVYSLIMVYIYVLIGYMAFSSSISSPHVPNVQSAGYMPTPYFQPTVLLAGFSADEVYEIRKKGVPATSLAEWARNASLYDISSRPMVYEGDSRWYSSRVAIFSGVAESDRSMLIYRIKSVVGPNVIFTSLTPLNSGYTLDSFLMNFKGAAKTVQKEKKKEDEAKDVKESDT